jgi:thiopeptide-type bacteriocin biosynthesis protein
VIALVDEEPRAEAAIATARAGRVPPPHVEGPAPGWQTFKLFGAPDRADAVLLGVVRPYINDALASKSMSRWFYLRYLDAPGRPHVRLRVFCRKGGDARLDEYLAPARAAGDVVAVERAEYFREHARYGRENFPLVEEIFQLDSELALSLLESVEDPLERVLLSLDTLASSLPLSERRALAGRRRDAHEGEWTEDLSPEYRARQRRLLELLAAPPDECLRARAALPRIDEKLFAPLLHLSVVRHDPQLEASAYYFWERALDGLSHRR